MAAVVRTNVLDATWQTILSLENGGSFGSLEVATTAGGELFIYIDGDESYGGPIVAGEWLMVAVTKTAGTSVPRMHVYRYSTGTWVHEDGDAPVGDVSTVVQTVAFGAWEQTQDPWDGQIAAVAMWDAALTEQQLDGLTARLADWLTSGAVAVWPLGTDPVVDATGGGADQTGGSGTTVVDDPNLPFDPSPSSGDDHQGAGVGAGLLLTAGPGAGVPAVAGSGVVAAVQLLATPGEGSPAATGSGAAAAIQLHAAPGEGSPAATGAGTATTVVLLPGTGTGAGDSREEHSGSGLTAVLTLAPVPGAGAPAVAGAGTSVVTTLTAGLGTGTGEGTAAGAGLPVLVTLAAGYGAGRPALVGAGAAAGVVLAPGRGSSSVGWEPDPQRTLVITADDRVFVIPGEQRTIYVRRA